MFFRNSIFGSYDRWGSQGERGLGAKYGLSSIEFTFIPSSNLFDFFQYAGLEDLVIESQGILSYFSLLCWSYHYYFFVFILLVTFFIDFSLPFLLGMGFFFSIDY